MREKIILKHTKQKNSIKTEKGRHKKEIKAINTKEKKSKKK